MTRVYYRYRNPGFAAIDLWLAEPRDGLTQKNVITVLRSQFPREQLDTGGNSVARYRIGPFQTLAVDWEFTPIVARVGGRIVDRDHFLRASPQIGREPELVGEARRITGGMLDAPYEAAHALFLALARGPYRYRYPVFRRGALAMQHGHYGDCAQFTALFVAWCRALGIPARAVVGTLIDHPGLRAHVWGEFWVDGSGWVPVDPTFGHSSGRPDSFFGHLPSDRFAFSYDLDVPLPGYGPKVWLPPLNAILSPLWLGSRHLRWGAQTLDGTVPYLQPAYPRMYAGWGPDLILAPPTNGVWSPVSPPSSVRAAGGQVVGILALCAICIILLSDLIGNALLRLLGWALLVLSVAIAGVLMYPQFRPE